MLYINREECDDIQQQIDLYIKYFAEKFPNSKLPKHHFLEHHVVPWIRRWKSVMALHGEQGGEAIHREFNRISFVYKSVMIPTQRLLKIIEEHHVIVNPIMHNGY